MDRIQQVIDSLDPEEALQAVAGAVKKLLALLGHEARLQFVVNLLEDAPKDKVASLVHL